MKKTIMVVFMLLVNDLLGTDVSELLKKYGCKALVSNTSTSLVIKFQSAGFAVSGRPMRGMARRSADYAANNDDLVLTLDEETKLVQRHASIIFAPVSYKSKQRGFRITEVFDTRSFGHGITSNITYLALSDAPVKVGEDDVAMIMENGEWKKFEREVDVIASPPSCEKTVTITQDETPAGVAEDEQNEEKSKVSNLWLYAIIVLCIFSVILWVVKKRRT